MRSPRRAALPQWRQWLGRAASTDAFSFGQELTFAGFSIRVGVASSFNYQVKHPTARSHRKWNSSSFLFRAATMAIVLGAQRHHYDADEAASTFTQIDPVGILGVLFGITERERNQPL